MTLQVHVPPGIPSQNEIMEPEGLTGVTALTCIGRVRDDRSSTQSAK